MTDPLKHECGIALIRLRKPFGYYVERYGSPSYAVNKLFLLMEKQHNRGQDGAGIASIKLHAKPGLSYVDRLRSIANQPIVDIFQQVGKHFNEVKQNDPKQYLDPFWMQGNVPFTGELLLGHLRYSTYGKNSTSLCHPRMRHSNWRSRTLLMAGNFNMTNVDELMDKVISLGQHPKEKTDTLTVLEKIGHFLELEQQALFEQYKKTGDKTEVIERIEQELDLQRVLQRSCKDFDGGYAMVGLTGYGAAFVARDQAGIRPAYYYADDEVIVCASEKPAIKTTFNVRYEDIKEIDPAHALIIDKDGNFEQKPFDEPRKKTSCSFERIYFSRGTDPKIYEERKELGKLLCPEVIDIIGANLDDTIFSYIPNTAETSFLGLVKGMEDFLIKERIKALSEHESASLTHEKLEEVLSVKPRVEKLVIKDTKMRTFITGDDERDDLVAHVYDTTYEIVKKNQDTVVIIDDSIVRGTTLEKSILTMLSRLEPKRIVILSSAPQIRFPDCYGIDMSKMHDFIAFRAVLELLKDHQMTYLLQEVYHKCKDAMQLPAEKIVNHVKEIYEPFTYEQVSDKVAELISRPVDNDVEVKVVYQTVENLHKACPDHIGDWYFTGDYPTPGGNKVANLSFINFIEGKRERAY